MLKYLFIYFCIFIVCLIPRTSPSVPLCIISSEVCVCNPYDCTNDNISMASNQMFCVKAIYFHDVAEFRLFVHISLNPFPPYHSQHQRLSLIG